MNGMPVTPQAGRTPDRERRFGYRRRIRGTMYIWGSAGITSNLHFPTPLIFYLRNDAFGEPVTVRTETADGGSTTIGTLGAGEYLAIPIQDIRGISAACDLESTVSYMLSGDHGECLVALEPSRMDPDPRPNSF